MAETLKDACAPIGTEKWHWYNVHADLVEQGGLADKELVINPLSFREASFCGTYKDMPFRTTWVKDMFLMVSFPQYSADLINAFSKVVEYKPFAKYQEPKTGLITVEWDKVDPNKRYRELQKEGKLELTRFSD